LNLCFYESALGQSIYNRRGISTESLSEHIKSVFRIDPLPARGFQVVSAIVLISFALSDNGILYCKKDKSDLKSIKYMIGTY
jgi:hypothetical protein